MQGKEALASHLNMDYADLSYYEYQSGRFSRAVYAFDDAYYCVVKDPKKVAKSLRKAENHNFNWVEVPDYWVNGYGWLIFKSDVISELPEN